MDTVFWTAAIAVKAIVIGSITAKPQ